MATLSAALGSAAAPHTINSNGKTYAVSPIIAKVRSKMERWLEDRALEAHLRYLSKEVELGLRSLEQANDARKQFVDEIIAGKYRFGGPEFNRSITVKKTGDDDTVDMGQIPEAYFKLCALMLDIDDMDEFWTLLLANPQEVLDKCKIAMGESGVAPKEQPPTVATTH